MPFQITVVSPYLVSLSVVSVTHGHTWSENIKFVQSLTSSAPHIQPLTSSWLDDPGSPETDDPPSDIVLGHDACVIPLTSAHNIGICRLTSSHKKSEQ